MYLGSFWAVIDGFVVDASEFVDKHPGGLRKLLSADSPAAGATLGSTFCGKKIVSVGSGPELPQSGNMSPV